jgi:hypothetical protein
VVEEVADSTIGVDCAPSCQRGTTEKPGAGGAGHTLTVYRHFDHFDIAVLAKDFGDVSFRDIFGELFNHNL